MNEKIEKKSGKGSRLEAVLALMLLALIGLSVAFAVVLTVDYIQSRPNQPNDDPNNNLPTSKIIFSNGVVPTIPVADSNTETAVLESEYGVIVDVKNGKVLAGKNADTKFAPASMTKVMTLIVACEKLTEADLDKQIEYTEYYKTYDYNGLDLALSTLPVGRRVLVKDMLYGIGVKSAGDCTLMIAEYTYGTQEAFVEAMNKKVAELGLTQTHFVDASGDDFPENYTTAKEMAVIMAYAMQCPLICDILSEDGYEFYPRYTDQNGEEQKDDRLTHWSTLFELGNGSSRMDKYKKEYGKKFTLNTVDGLMGKTGYLNNPDRSYLVCGATGKTTGNEYVVVVGETHKFAYTMKDIKTLYDGYAE